KIISGTVSIVGKTYYLTLSLISVKTGKIENVAEDTCRCEVDELLGSTKRLAKKLLGEQVEQPVATTPKPVPVAESKAKADAIAKAEAKQHELKGTTAAIAPPAGKAKIVAYDGRFEKLASGIVRDKQSGLDWYAGPDKNTVYDDAKGWVANLMVDGGGWRMPTLEELKGLYRKGAGSRNMTPLLETTGWLVWSGETAGPGGVRALDFDNGLELLDRRDNSIYKRGFAVRSRR
ncbi:MAG: DUF1566 domain-containing protein, partial [Proteobacteria bacterium]|nr:DUF1566 domain-containing protein [Pseudomonadota bacterium]